MLRSFVRIAKLSLWSSSIVLLSLGAHGQTAVPDRLTASIDDSAVTTLKGNVPALAQAQYDLGATPVSQSMSHLKLVLQRSAAQEAALENYLQSVQQAGSPNYHKWLTPEQFGTLYGPSDGDVQKLTGWLASQGFTVNQVAPGRTTVDFSGSVAQVQTAFHTSIHSFRANGVEFVSNTSDPQIPTAFAEVVSGVGHLNTIPLKPMYVKGFAAKYDPTLKRIVPLSTAGLRRSLNEQDENGDNVLV